MKENRSNLQLMCKDCSKKMKDEWQEKNRETIIKVGDIVKIAFRDGDRVEHMWVIIKKIGGNPLNRICTFEGKLG